MRVGPSPLTTVPRPPENGEQEVMAPMQWRDATVGGQDTTIGANAWAAAVDLAQPG